MVAAHEAYEETLEDCITELTQKLEALRDGLPEDAAGAEELKEPKVVKQATWAAKSKKVARLLDNLETKFAWVHGPATAALASANLIAECNNTEPGFAAEKSLLLEQLQNLGATAAALEEALAQAKASDVNPVPAEPGIVTTTTPTDTEHKPKWVNRYSDTVADAGDTADVDTTLEWDVDA